MIRIGEFATDWFEYRRMVAKSRNADAKLGLGELSSHGFVEKHTPGGKVLEITFSRLERAIGLRMGVLLAFLRELTHHLYT